MAKVGRNEPCPCGSRKKSKRCCYSVQSMQARADLVRARRELAVAAQELLQGVEPFELDELFSEAVDLPKVDLSMQVHLPKVLTSGMQRARTCVKRGDEAALEVALERVAREPESYWRRRELMEVLISLMTSGEVRVEVGAVALLDLMQDDSAVYVSSLEAAIRASAGESRTPAGLVVAVA